MTKEFKLEYENVVGLDHRRNYGQFFTNPDVAKFMVDWVLASGETSIYDPAFGLGAFYNAIENHNSVEFTASEIDPVIIRYFGKLYPDFRIQVTEEDYLLNWDNKRSNIVCNPPYMRFQKFIDREKTFKIFNEKLGVRISGYTNTASAFLLKSISELKSGGRLAYIMPLEFLNTGYGRLVKSRLIEKKWLRSIISLECEKDAFPDVITSVGIILMDTMCLSSHVDFHVVSNISELQKTLAKPPRRAVPISKLNPSDKWLQYFQEDKIKFNAKGFVPLNYYGQFIRGIATGANEYFVGSPSHYQKHDISETEITPCITRSAQIRKNAFSEDDYKILRENDEKVVLFTPGATLSPGAKNYIKIGEQSKYHMRYLTRHRSPWYKTEVRTPAPLLVGVFTRGHFKVVRNYSQAVNLTCYHGFYPNLFGRQYVDHLFLFLLSNAGQALLSLSNRRYGDSLNKFEPNDLNCAVIPTPEYFDSIPEKTIKNAVETLKKGDPLPDDMNAIFDSLIKKPNSRCNPPSTCSYTSLQRINSVSSLSTQAASAILKT